MQQCDLLLTARWVVTVDDDNRVLDNAGLAIRGGRIVAIDSEDSLRRQWQAREHIDCGRAALLPGLVNTHTHAAMSLFRGIADDVPLETWLNEHIWPLEGQHANADFVRDGTRLAIAEMIRSGTTCFNDMYFCPDVVAEVANEARIRASIGLIVIEFPTVWASGPDEYLSKAMQVYDAHAADTLLSMQFAPHSTYAVTEATLKRVRTQADQLDIGVHIHLHETVAEVQQHAAQHGERPFATLDRLGLVNDRLLAVHMTQLSSDEIARAAERGISIAHCPESNMKLASGSAPVADLISAGVNVALGSDGAASNNDLDLFGEMRSAALLGKVTSADASRPSAAEVLRMATAGGATALGIDEVTGSLSAGKSADVIAVRMDQPHTTPCFDPVGAIVYAAGRSDVSDVWVAGRRLMNARQLTTIDESSILERAVEWQSRLGKA
ncbi:MAG: TRZ/ATZ family hydrolase [Pseudomonadota bacterium]